MKEETQVTVADTWRLRDPEERLREVELRLREVATLLGFALSNEIRLGLPNTNER